MELRLIGKEIFLLQLQMLLMLSKAYNQLGQKQAAIERASRGIEIANLWQQTILINQFRRQQYLAEDQ